MTAPAVDSDGQLKLGDLLDPNDPIRGNANWGAANESAQFSSNKVSRIAAQHG